MSALPPTFVPGFSDEESVRSLKYARLGNTDMMVANLSLGGCTFGQLYGEMEKGVAMQMIREAVRKGVNYIDTAPYYGQGKSEEFIGDALVGVPRKAYYLTTKVARYGLWNEPDMFDFSRAKVLQSFEESLKILKTDYVDLLQIHDVEFCVSLSQIVDHTIPALVELKAQGKAKAIGITGYNISVLKKIVKMAPPGSIDTVLSYSRYTLFNKDLGDSIEFFHRHNVGVINAAPLGIGLISNPDRWHMKIGSAIEAVKKATQYCKDKGADLPSLAVKWCAHNEVIPGCLVSAITMAQLEANLASARNPLTQSEKQLLDELQLRFFAPMPITQWENLEVVQYWKMMEEKGWKQQEH